MADLNDAELNALAKAAGIEIPPELLTEVGYSLNAILDALDQIEVPDLDRVEPLPIILPPSPQAGSAKPMNQPGIPFLTALDLADLIKSRQLSPVEATEAFLSRIDQIDSQLNAYITVCRDDALAAARQAENEIAAGNYRGPMHGIPVAVKDQMLTQGVLTTNGSSILKDFVPDEDATVIAKIKGEWRRFVRANST